MSGASSHGWPEQWPGHMAGQDLLQVHSFQKHQIETHGAHQVYLI